MKTIEHYQLKQEIGHGGMSTVYLAHDTRRDQEVAIKVLRDALSNNPRAQKRFASEARLVMNLNHPGIVTVLDHGEADGHLFIVMTYMPGGSIRPLIEDRVLSLENTVKFLRPVMSALSAMHARNIIHRDIKPHNILLDESGQAYLSDFGVARLLDEVNEETITFLGTPEYVAPEQALQGDLSPQTDIYQLGVTAFQMLTGTRPYTGSPYQIIWQHLNEPVPSAEALNPELPAGTDMFFQIAMAKSAEDRFQSVEAFMKELEILAQELTTTRLFVPPSSPHPQAEYGPSADAIAFAPATPDPGKTASNRPFSPKAMVIGFLGTGAVVGLMFLAGLLGAPVIIGDVLMNNEPAESESVGTDESLSEEGDTSDDGDSVTSDSTDSPDTEATDTESDVVIVSEETETDDEGETVSVATVDNSDGTDAGDTADGTGGNQPPPPPQDGGRGGNGGGGGGRRGNDGGGGSPPPPRPGN